MILEQIYQHAILRPNKIAIKYGKNELSYFQLCQLIDLIAEKIQRNGVRKGQIVASCYTYDKLMDLLVTLSLYKLSAISVSTGSHTVPKLSFNLDWIISNDEFRPQNLKKQIFIDRSLIQEGLIKNHPLSILDKSDHHALSRLILTSGTTGTRKAVPLSSDQIFTRVMHGALTLSSFGNEFCLFGLSTTGGINGALRSLLLGNVFYPDIRDLSDALDKDEVGLISGSPLQIQGLIRSIQSKNSSQLKCIMMGGSKLPGQLAKVICNELQLTLLDYYGSTEVGGVFFNIYPPNNGKKVTISVRDTKIQIVNEDGLTLPANFSGIVKIKSNSMAKGYFNDLAASQKYFINEWFYPGDTGQIDSNGTLILGGRISEVINIGGVKIDPHVLDEFTKQWSSITDCASFGTEGPNGIDQVAIAIVTSEEIDLSIIRQAFKKKFGNSLVPKYFFKVQKIPRNQMGKIARTQLKQAFEFKIDELKKNEQ